MAVSRLKIMFINLIVANVVSAEMLLFSYLFVRSVVSLCS